MSRLYTLGKLATYPVVRLLFRMRYEGVENIPPEGGFILASNHRSMMDPVFITHKVPAQLRFMAKSELFRFKPFGWLIANLGAFPVARGKGDDSAMEAAEQAVRDGHVLMIFPEGTRSKDGKPLRARSGVALIAGKVQADVLPCAVVYPPGPLRLFLKVRVCYGKPIPYADLGIDLGSPSTIRGASRRIMDEIVSLMDTQKE